MSLFTTIRTALGYSMTLLTRHFPNLSRDNLASIFNYLPIDKRIATSGQPTVVQFKAVKEAGFQVVINLAPSSGENSLKDERTTLTNLGLQYVHIPVDFRNPTDEDFSRFCAAMQEAREKRVFVHCAANMRVSAFVYRYRCQILGDDPQNALRDLQRIWEPTGVWKRFIESTSH